MLAITICSTKSYCYAMEAQASRVAAALAYHPPGMTVCIILVGDQSQEFSDACKRYREIIGDEMADFFAIKLDGLEESLNYKQSAQLLIARMREAAFREARRRGAAFCWSLDSDVLPPPNSLHCMRQMLEFDNGYYSVSTCPYPSQGGVAFLGGRGTPENPILPDVYEDERKIPNELKKEIAAHRAMKRSEITFEEWSERDKAIREKINKCEPRGNIFALQAKGWRPRGWLWAAYPGVGLGAVVPTDWCGFGCTLMNAKALSLAHFEGYDGAGTEDLYIVWKRWNRGCADGLRINAITHAPCDHVIRCKDADGRLTGYRLQHAYHEHSGDARGHLRVESRVWIRPGHEKEDMSPTPFAKPTTA